MKLPTLTRTALSLMLLATLGACQQRNRSLDAGLQAQAAPGCEAARYDSPMRMFTAAGEVKNPEVIDTYRAVHGLQGDCDAAGLHPEHILSSSSQRVFFNGMAAVGAAAPNEVVIMRQQDTGMVGVGRDQGTIDAQFEAEQAFLSLREQILRMDRGTAKLQRVDEQNYRLQEIYRLKGQTRDHSIRLPYTFIATRSRIGPAPCLLRKGALPSVPAGDTVLVREGFLALR